MSKTPPSYRRRRWLGPVAVTAFFLAVLAAWMRGGALDLPPVPAGLGLEATGLDDLEALGRLDAFVRGGAGSAALDGFGEATCEAAQLVRRGFEDTAQGYIVGGLERVRDGLRHDPSNLVLGNAYRMLVFRLRRDFLLQASANGQLTPSFPPHLQGQPIELFEELTTSHAEPSVRLQLALAWVDEMLLFPALEIKAPSSVESVDILSHLLQQTPGYVPALYARGMNHLHRPARLVWPESEKTPPDAAARDFKLCIAIGRRFGVGSPHLQARLAVALGDAYVKAGRLGVARSWWQIAQNLSSDAEVQDAVHRRYGWRDEEVLERLEEDLDRARSQLDTPMTDLALMWS